MPLRPRRDPCQYQAITTKCHCPLRGLRQAVRQRRAMQNLLLFDRLRSGSLGLQVGLQKTTCVQSLSSCALPGRDRLFGAHRTDAHFERFAMSRVSLCRELQHESIYHMTSVRGCREPSHAECDNHADGSFTRCPGIHICPYTWRVV